MIKVYGTNNCSFCYKAKVLLEELDYNFEYIVLSDKETLSEFKELFPGKKTVPQIMFDGEYIGGYNELVEFLNKG